MLVVELAVVETALPGDAPAAVEAAHAVGVGAGDQDTGAGGEREYAVGVFEQYHRLDGGLAGQGSMLGRGKVGIGAGVGHGCVEEAQAVLEAEHPAHGVVDTAHRHCALLDQLTQQSAVVPLIRLHGHVDAGVDGHGDGFLFVAGHALARPEIVDVVPVGDNHAVPSRLVLEPAGEQALAGVYGHTVDAGRVDHHCERSGAYAGQIGGKMLLAQVGLAHHGRGAVFAAHGRRVCHIVLDRCGDVGRADVIGVGALEAVNLRGAHAGAEQRVFAEILPHAGPGGIAHQVDCGRVSPRASRGAGLVGRDGGRVARQGGVKGGGHVDILREKRAAGSISRAMILVESVYAGDADAAHRLILNGADDSPPLLGRYGAAGHIEYRADLVLADDSVEHPGLEYHAAVGAAVGNHVDIELCHLADFLVESHAGQRGLYSGLEGLVARDGRSGGRRCQGGHRGRHKHSECLKIHSMVRNLPQR